MFRPDLTFKEVLTPHNRWCKSGHAASETFRREGPDSEALPTRFFHVTSDFVPDVNGTYCEPCLVVANAVGRAKKMEMKHG